MKNGYTCIVTDFELKFDVLVAESHPQYILGAVMDHMWSLFKTLFCKAAGGYVE